MGVTVGLIDTGVNALHPALRGTNVQLNYFVDQSRELPETHGTAVVSLLVPDKALFSFGLLILLGPERTTLIVAHRISTITLADRGDMLLGLRSLIPTFNATLSVT